MRDFSFIRAVLLIWSRVRMRGLVGLYHQPGRDLGVARGHVEIIVA